MHVLITYPVKNQKVKSKKKKASGFYTELIKGYCVWFPHCFTRSLFCLRLKSPQDSKRLTVLQQSSHCVRREMHWAHPKLSKRQTVHLSSKQSPDIAARVIANGRHLLCVPDKGIHLTVTWFDVHTRTRSQIYAWTWAYTNTGAHLMQIRGDTHTTNLSFCLSLPSCCLDVHVSGRCTMSQAGEEGKKKKLCSHAKAGLPVTYQHVQPCDKSRHSNLTSQTCPYGYLSPVTLSIPA